MRILMTTDTVGGVWTFTKELALGLLKNGCSVALVSLGRFPSLAQAAWAQEQRETWGARFRYDALDADRDGTAAVGLQSRRSRR